MGNKAVSEVADYLTVKAMTIDTILEVLEVQIQYDDGRLSTMEAIEKMVKLYKRGGFWK